jgi:xanthine dehydrogenase accessory factor
LSSGAGDWVEALAGLRASGLPVAVVTVVKVEGSTPRDTGAKMLVTHQGLAWGSIGGGNLEALAIADAKACLEKGEPAYHRYPLCVKAGQCCGGNTEVFIEVLGRGPLLYLFGAGHVGRALCYVLQGTPFQIHLVDPRPDWLDSPQLPSGLVRHGEAWEGFVAQAEWSERVFAVVLTHSHDLDLELIRNLAPRNAAYLGLIGSRTKWARFQSLLKADGLAQGRLDRVRCPIGLDLGPGKSPQEVAIAVAAQLLKVLNK